jgi:DHA2 family metal-tetracycline-proton antiporter-like MFS transporter
MSPIMLRELDALGASAIGLVLFPGAMSAALLGRAGGRLVDRVGGVKVAYAAAAMLFLGYLLLSTSAGRGPAAVALSLVFCYVGFSFVQSSMAHTVSGTLSRGEVGAGMGIYNMCFFMSGAFTASALGRLLDTGAAGSCLNPFAACGGAALYSNLYLLLAALALLAAAALYAAFGRRAVG